MKNFILITAMCLSLVQVQGSDTLTVSGNINAVTVFFSGATVHRTADLVLPRGASFVVLEGLPLQADINSLNLREPEGMSILAVKEFSHPAGRPKKADQEDPVVKAFEDEMDRLLRGIAEIDNRLEVLVIEEEVLMSNSVVKERSTTTSLDEIKRLASYLSQRINAIRVEKLDLKESHSDQMKKLKEKRDELNRYSNSTLTTPESLSVLLQVDSETAIEAKLEISYFVASANWIPAYDFKVKSNQEPMTIFYKAKVTQSTGEDWTKVKVTLSMANPQLDNTKPEIRKWNLAGNFPYADREKTVFTPGSAGALSGVVSDAQSGEPLPFVNVAVSKDGRQLNSATTDFDGRYRIKPLDPGAYDVGFSFVGYNSKSITGVSVRNSRLSMLDATLHPAMVLEEVEIVEYNSPLISRDAGTSGGTVKMNAVNGVAIRGSRAQQQYYIDDIEVNGLQRITNEQLRGVKRQNLAALEYEIDQAHTIRSDGRDYTLKIRSSTVETEYMHVVAPIIEPDVYLLASVTEWEELNLTEGDAGIFYDQTYTGKTRLNPMEFTDTMTVSLGRDKAISVKRDEKREAYELKFLGNTVRETLVYTISLRNAKSSAVQLRVHDQIPVSSQKSVTVELLDDGGARVDGENGYLTWDLLLQPGESRELSFAFVVKHPR